MAKEQSQQQRVDAYLTQQFGAIVGKKITAIRALNQAEADAAGVGDWFGGFDPIVIVELENGNGLILSRDPEGNGPGFGMLLS